MVSPDLLGASTGACFGAALAILLGASYAVITAGSFLFRPCGGGADVSGRAAEPDALESGDGAGGRDGRVAVFRRNLLY
ncbi:MAG: hypothetical protein ACLU3I_22280 [Acutalibacteraceae bacterium]